MVVAKKKVLSDKNESDLRITDTGKELIEL